MCSGRKQLWQLWHCPGSQLSCLHISASAREFVHWADPQPAGLHEDGRVAGYDSLVHSRHGRELLSKLQYGRIPALLSENWAVQASGLYLYVDHVHKYVQPAVRP